MDDRDLVVAFKAGEPGAYDEMYRRYSARVSGVCRRMLSNRDDAQEAVQETFLKAYVGLPEFNGNYRLGAWLGRIATNVCLDALRAKARSANVVPLQPEAATIAVESSPEEMVVGDAPEIARQIGEMQPLHVRALVLRGVEGLSHREIAGRLSLTPAQVKALLHRARRSFKRSWDSTKEWALAPMVLLRDLSRQLRDASQTGTQVAGATATVSPMLAERVAASAMIVAVALSGLPDGAVTRNSGGAKTARRAPRTSEWQMIEPKASIRDATPSRPHRPLAPRPHHDAASTVKAEVVSTVEKVLARAQGTVGRPSRKRSDDGDRYGGNKIGPHTLEDAAAETIETVEDLVDP